MEKWKLNDKKNKEIQKSFIGRMSKSPKSEIQWNVLCDQTSQPQREHDGCSCYWVMGNNKNNN